MKNIAKLYKKLRNINLKIGRLDLMLIFLIIFIGTLSYFPILNYKYIVPPGDDVFRHAFYIKKMSIENSFIEYPVTPPNFYILLVSIFKISHVEILKLLLIFYPLLMPLSSMTYYIMAKIIFNNKKLALLSTVFYSFSGALLHTINDGSYYGVLASNILLFILIYSLFNAIYKKEIKKVYLSFILLISIAYYHHLSFILTIIIVFPLYIYLYKIYIKNYYFKIIFLNIIFILSLIPLWRTYISDIINILVSFLDIISKKSSLENIKGITVHNVIKLSNYKWEFGEFIWYLGIMGVFIIFCSLFCKFPYFNRKINNNHNFSLLYILYIFTVVFLLSRTEYSFFPERYMRWLQVPLSILSAYTTYFILSVIFHVEKSKNSKLSRITIIPLILVGTLFAGYDYYLAKSPYQRVTKDDLNIVKFLDNYTNTNDNILAGPLSGHLRIYLNNQIFLVRCIKNFNSVSDNVKNIWNLYYFPNNSEKLFVKYNISYVYAVTRPLNQWVPGTCKWNSEQFAKTPFLIEIARFKNYEKYNVIIIFKVNQTLLANISN